MSYTDIFSRNDATSLYHGKVRIGEYGIIEQYVSVIQHRKVGDREIGDYHHWEPVLCEGKKIKINAQVVDIAICLLTSEVRVVYPKEFFVDESGCLCAQAAVFLPNGEFIPKNPIYIFHGGKRLLVTTSE